MAKTVATLQSELMAEFGLEETNDNEGTSSARVLEYINKAHQNFFNHKAWNFNVLLYSFQTIAPTTTLTTFTTSDTTITLSSTVGWGTSGYVLIDKDIIRFTANQEVNGILTVDSTTIDRDHTSTGERATLLYEMPSTFSRPSQVLLGNRAVLFPEDVRVNDEPSHNRYWIYNVFESGGIHKALMQLPTSTDICYIKYSKKPEDLNNVNTSNYYLDVPIPNYFDYIKYYVMGRMYAHVEEFETANQYKIDAKIELEEASVFDAKQHHNPRVPIRTRWDNPSGVLHSGINKYRTNG